MAARLLRLCIVFIFVFASCSRDDQQPADNGIVDKDPMSVSEINAEIDKTLRTGNVYNWQTASTYMLWSATQHGDHLVSIGFGNSKDDVDRSLSAKASSVQQQILELISKYESADALVAADQYLTTIDVVIHRQETIAALRKFKSIRYIEPANYRYFEHQALMRNPIETASGVSSGSGCGYESIALNPSDYTTITPNAKAGWTLYQHNVPSAWNYSTGAGTTIGIIDTGLSPQQTMLGSSFNDGMSQGRTLQKFGVYVDSAWPWSSGTDGVHDLCGHGTSMASAAAAPRNDNGMPVGVAYNSNLITYRAASNVVLDGYHEQNGVKNAFTALGNNGSVKIISMSMGHVFSVGKISDGVKYAYNKGKMIFCAGGTSTSFTTFVGVIFPASMAETIAVTGVKEGVYQKCSDCHSGSKIEFTVAMQRNSGSTAPVVSYYDNQTDYVGGSSVATATTAGIAALVWSKNPTWTRAQVLAKLRSSSHFYPVKNSEFGYGNINALTAVQ